MSNLKVNGTIKAMLEIEKGVSKAGKEWQKRSFIIDTNSNIGLSGTTYWTATAYGET